MRRGGWLVSAVLVAACAAAPETAVPRSLPDAWREAGQALPAGEARTAYDRAATDAVAQAERLRAAERRAFAALVHAGERHAASRAELYAPLATLAEERRAILRDYARARLAMRAAVTPASTARAEGSPACQGSTSQPRPSP